MTFNIALVNCQDGSVQAHKPGCRDIVKKAGSTNPFYGDTWEIEVDSQMDAYATYNEDFILESDWDNQYHIRFMPCCPTMPVWDAKTAEFARENNGTNVPEAEVEGKPTVKVGRKWTTIHAADGSLIAEVRNDQVALVKSLLG